MELGKERDCVHFTTITFEKSVIYVFPHLTKEERK